jgi:hypothetical protein
MIPGLGSAFAGAAGLFGTSLGMEQRHLVDGLSPAQQLDMMMLCHVQQLDMMMAFGSGITPVYHGATRMWYTCTYCDRKTKQPDYEAGCNGCGGGEWD